MPLFVFLGLLIEATGMTRARVTFLSSLLGHVRGGLTYVLIGAMYLVSGISGSKVADMAAVVPVLFPEMRQRGAQPGDLVALLATSGAQTETIPPRLLLITIGSVTGVSIAALFTGGMLPGVVMGAALCAVIGWRYRREDLSQVKRATGRQVGQALLVALRDALPRDAVLIAVANNGSWAIEVRDPQETHGKVVGTRLQFADHAAMARAEDLLAAIQRALAVLRTGRPALLDVLVTPEAVSSDAKSGLAWVPDLQALSAWDQAEQQWRKGGTGP